MLPLVTYIEYNLEVAKKNILTFEGVNARKFRSLVTKFGDLNVGVNFTVCISISF